MPPFKPATFKTGTSRSLGPEELIPILTPLAAGSRRFMAKPVCPDAYEITAGERSATALPITATRSSTRRAA